MRQPSRQGVRRRVPLGGGCAVLLMVWALVGCSVHSVPDQIAPPVEIPKKFSISGEAPQVDRWWETFDDPDLNALMNKVLAENLSLQATYYRIVQAEAAMRQVASDLWPQLVAELGVERARTIFNSPITGKVQDTEWLYSLGFSASYEVDLWRRVHSLRSAAELDMQATSDDRETAAITLAAEAGQTWMTLLEQRAQYQLLLDQIETSNTFLELTELRFAQGQASALDVYQQRTHVASLDAQLPTVLAQQDVLEHALAVLAGRPAVEYAAPEGNRLPRLMPLPEVGVPASLLKRRPDVRAAHARLAAADYRVASAIADMLPALRLGATSVHRGVDPNVIFNEWLWSIAANLTQPLLDGGRRQAEVDRNRAIVQERLRLYGQTILTAIREVEDALAQEREQHARVAALRRQLELAEATLEQARTRYVNGLSDYLNVLTALDGLHANERQLLSARRELILFRIRLYRALGGAWPAGLAPPQPLPVSEAEGDAQ